VELQHVQKNVTGSYTRVKAHFLWLEGDNGVQHCKKIDRKDVDRFQTEQDVQTCKRELSPAHLVYPWRHNA
jgi:hypothetical protein